VHEIAPDVKFQHKAIVFIVFALAPDVPFQTLYAVMRSTSFDATVAILYERAFKQLVCIVVIQMVNNTVGELRCKDFPFLGVFHYKATGGFWLVGTHP
jgi:hypothetical protein